MSPLLKVFLGIILLINTSCAGLPTRPPLPEAESEMVRNSFRQMVLEQRQCSSFVDADLTVTIDSKFYSGTMSGYLLAMVPSSLKIVGINPFGQPLVVLITDGQKFKYALLNESLSYEGEVGGESFQRYAPTGFDPATSFYSLIGRFSPGEVRILNISGDPEGRGVWLQVEQGNDQMGSLLLFDPERRIILKHIKLDESAEKMTMEIAYSEHQRGECGLPVKISVSSKGHSGNLILRLDNWQAGETFSADDFEMEFPPSFQRVQVK